MSPLLVAVLLFGALAGAGLTSSWRSSCPHRPTSVPRSPGCRSSGHCPRTRPRGLQDRLGRAVLARGGHTARVCGRRSGAGDPADPAARVARREGPAGP
jgi:hypothetical protein